MPDEIPPELRRHTLYRRLNNETTLHLLIRQIRPGSVLTRAKRFLLLLTRL